MGGLFSQFKGLFFHVGAFLLRLSPYRGPFSRFKSLSATFFSMLGPFCYVFLLMGGFFLYLKALCYFFLYVGAFLIRFSSYGGLFSTFEGLSATFFSPCGGVVFVFMGTLFWLAPPTKISAGAHACVSLNLYE